MLDRFIVNGRIEPLEVASFNEKIDGFFVKQRYEDLVKLLFYYPIGENASFLLKKELDLDSKRVVEHNYSKKRTSKKFGGTLFWVGLEEIVIVSSVQSYISGDGLMEKEKNFNYILSDWLQRTVGNNLSDDLQTIEGLASYNAYLMDCFRPSYKQLNYVRSDLFK